MDIKQALTDNAGTTWQIDPAHSDATFTVRHAGIAKVHGEVPIASGTITVGNSLADTTIQATLDATGISSGTAQRDEHLRSPDFFDVTNHPTWTFTSTSIQGEDDEATMTGDLTIHGVTRPITLKVEFAGIAQAGGEVRAGFSARGELSRKDFGLTWNAPIEAGGVLVSDKVVLNLDVAFVKQ